MVAIGVTGHRILTELDKINAGVAEALHRIEQAFPGQPLTVISALAEGADGRLVVRQVLARPNARLVAPCRWRRLTTCPISKWQSARAGFNSLWLEG